MKSIVVKNTIRGVLLFGIIAVLGLSHTGSAVHADENDINKAAVSVVDKRSVGQTENEIEAGMNNQAVYDEMTSTVTWKIGKNYELVEGYTYYITFKVEDGVVVPKESKMVKFGTR